MPKFNAGDRVRVRAIGDSAAPPDYVWGKAAIVENLVEPDAAAEAGSLPRYRVRVDRFPDDVYKEGMRRHHNIPEDWLEPAQE